MVGFRSVEYDVSATLRDLVAAGLPTDPLREPPVAHPTVDPGLESTTPNAAEASA